MCTCACVCASWLSVGKALVFTLLSVTYLFSVSFSLHVIFSVFVFSALFSPTGTVTLVLSLTSLFRHFHDFASHANLCAAVHDLSPIPIHP